MVINSIHVCLSHSTLSHSAPCANSSSNRTARNQRAAVQRSNNAAEDPQKCLAARAVPPCLHSAYGINETATNAKNGQVRRGYLSVCLYVCLTVCLFQCQLLCID